MIPVTLITANATQDPVTDDLYLAILRDMIEGGMSFRDVANALGYSAAWWNLRLRGERPLTHEGRQALRAHSDEFPPLPSTIAQVATELVDPDARVYLVGDLPAGELVRRVLLLASDGAIAVSANGTVSAMAVDEETREGGNGSVTPVTSGQGASRVDRRHRLTVSAENFAWLRENGMSVNEVIEGVRGQE